MVGGGVGGGDGGPTSLCQSVGWWACACLLTASAALERTPAAPSMPPHWQQPVLLAGSWGEVPPFPPLSSPHYHLAELPRVIKGCQAQAQLGGLLKLLKQERCCVEAWLLIQLLAGNFENSCQCLMIPPIDITVYRRTQSLNVTQHLSFHLLSFMWEKVPLTNFILNTISKSKWMSENMWILLSLSIFHLSILDSLWLHSLLSRSSGQV